MLIITGLGVGGAERQVCDLADAFCKLGHQVRLIYLTGEAAAVPRSNKVELVGMNMKRNPISLLGVLVELRKHVNDFSPDVVHSHMFHANLISRLLRVWVALPRLICTAHNTTEGGKLRSFLYRLTDSLADISTNVSQEAVQVFVESGAVPDGRMIPVYNGIDLYHFCPSHGDSSRHERDEIVLLAVGRLHPQKDYPNLLRAFGMLPELWSGKQLCLDIAGDGPERAYLETLARQIGVSKRVRFLGIRSDVPELMRSADLFVLSSAWEGFGLVVGEAMACKRVVVATDCGGVSEVVGEFGVLVPPQNSEALACGMRRALSLSEDESEALGRKARDHIESTFGLDAVVSRWLSIYGR